MKTQALCTDNFKSCLGLCGNPIYLSVFKQHYVFCAFLCDKDSRVETGLWFDRRRWGVWGGWGRQRGGGWTVQKMLRESSRSDENILNANLKGG